MARLRWTGIDPATGRKWGDTWVRALQAKRLTAAHRREAQRLRDAMRRGGRLAGRVREGGGSEWRSTWEHYRGDGAPRPEEVAEEGRRKCARLHASEPAGDAEEASGEEEAEPGEQEEQREQRRPRGRSGAAGTAGKERERGVVPREVWPTYACSELRGAGWEVEVGCRKGRKLQVHFTGTSSTEWAPTWLHEKVVLRGERYEEFMASNASKEAATSGGTEARRRHVPRMGRGAGWWDCGHCDAAVRECCVCGEVYCMSCDAEQECSGCQSERGGST